MTMASPSEEIDVEGITFVRVPAGSFLRGGTGNPDESPAASVGTSAFMISRHPVTNLRYAQFVFGTGHRPPPLLHDPIFGRPDHPVVGVNWWDTAKFCAWFGRAAGLKASLPTEAQWERAARGDDGRTFPWGEAPPHPDLVNCGCYLGSTSAVDRYPEGQSPFGLLDCSGNVWEWCSDWYDPDYYRDAAVCDPAGPSEGTVKVARGGSWRSERFRVGCAHRCFSHPSMRSDRHGFRIVASEVEPAYHQGERTSG
jgi:sulfatase modifying factor 1